MRRYLTLVCLLCLAIPAGISISGCSRDPGVNYCNGLGYGSKVTDIAAIDLEPRTTGISLAFGQTKLLSSPKATTCKGAAASVAAYQYGTTNRQLLDISPGGNLCAGSWNRNSGGGIADYTICNIPNPIPSSGGLPYSTAYVTATSNAVTSNPVEVYVHALVTSITLVGPTECLSQGQIAQLDAQGCYRSSVNPSNTPQPTLLCAPSTVTSAATPDFACPLPYVNTGGGLVQVAASTIPNCTAAIGTLTYGVGAANVGSINAETNQITAEQPGTTAITASVAGSGSSAGYFSTCPPRSISLRLANGSTTGTINHSVTQDLTTATIDTKGNTITGLTLSYQSTDPIDISVSAGAVTPSYPGVASITAICQPPSCNPSPINEVGRFGTGLPITSNPVNLTYTGANSDFVWYAAPGASQYVVPVELLTGTVGSTERLPFVPNSMQMDRLGTNIFFGSERELMIYNTISNAVTKQDTSAPGVVLAVSPNGAQVLVNDQLLGRFYLYSPQNGVFNTFSGLGNAASWTPDSNTLYITDSAALNNLPANVAAGITGHTDTLYVYALSTGWTTYPLPCSTGVSCANPSNGGQSLAITTPSVGAYISGDPTVAHAWCPSGIVGDYNSMIFYPQSDAVYTDAHDTNPLETDVLAATTDGAHILGASLESNQVTLSDIGVTIPAGACTVTTTGTPPNQVQTLDPLVIAHTLAQAPLSQVNGAAVSALNQIIASPNSKVAFFTYSADPTNDNAVLPYYLPGTGGGLGTVGYVPLHGASAITAPLAGAFTPDDSLFFVSTAGDNQIHYISVPPVITPSTPLVDTQQISPNLPACTPPSAGGVDAGCTYTGTSTIVPATAIAVKPRVTT